jgi:hypothetical protein
MSSYSRSGHLVGCYSLARPPGNRLLAHVPNSFYEKADRCQGTLLGLLLVP